MFQGRRETLARFLEGFDFLCFHSIKDERTIMQNYSAFLQNGVIQDIEGKGLELVDEAILVYGDAGETLAVFPVKAIYGIYLNPLAETAKSEG